MNYFIKAFTSINKKQELIQLRKKRKTLLNNNVGRFLSRGDIMTINFWSKSLNYYFEGLCLSVKKKNLSSFNTTITLRNYLQQTGIEVTVAYYLYRLFLHTIISDYKRKQIWYRSSKLYYLRNKENKASKINP